MKKSDQFPRTGDQDRCALPFEAWTLQELRSSTSMAVHLPFQGVARCRLCHSILRELVGSPRHDVICSVNPSSEIKSMCRFHVYHHRRFAAWKKCDKYIRLMNEPDPSIPRTVSDMALVDTIDSGLEDMAQQYLDMMAQWIKSVQQKLSDRMQSVLEEQMGDIEALWSRELLNADQEIDSFTAEKRAYALVSMREDARMVAENTEIRSDRKIRTSQYHYAEGYRQIESCDLSTQLSMMHQMASVGSVGSKRAVEELERSQVIKVGQLKRQMSRSMDIWEDKMEATRMLQNLQAYKDRQLLSTRTKNALTRLGKEQSVELRNIQRVFSRHTIRLLTLWKGAKQTGMDSEDGDNVETFCRLVQLKEGLNVEDGEAMEILRFRSWLRDHVDFHPLILFPKIATARGCRVGADGLCVPLACQDARVISSEFQDFLKRLLYPSDTKHIFKVIDKQTRGFLTEDNLYQALVPNPATHKLLLRILQETDYYVTVDISHNNAFVERISISHPSALPRIADVICGFIFGESAHPLFEPQASAATLIHPRGSAGRASSTPPHRDGAESRWNTMVFSAKPKPWEHIPFVRQGLHTAVKADVERRVSFFRFRTNHGAPPPKIKTQRLDVSAAKKRCRLPPRTPLYTRSSLKTAAGIEKIRELMHQGMMQFLRTPSTDPPPPPPSPSALLTDSNGDGEKQLEERARQTLSMAPNVAVDLRSISPDRKRQQELAHADRTQRGSSSPPRWNLQQQQQKQQQQEQEQEQQQQQRRAVAAAARASSASPLRQTIMADTFLSPSASSPVLTFPAPPLHQAQQVAGVMKIKLVNNLTAMLERGSAWGAEEEDTRKHHRTDQQPEQLDGSGARRKLSSVSQALRSKNKPPMGGIPGTRLMTAGIGNSRRSRSSVPLDNRSAEGTPVARPWGSPKGKALLSWSRTSTERLLPWDRKCIKLPPPTTPDIRPPPAVATASATPEIAARGGGLSALTSFFTVEKKRGKAEEAPAAMAIHADMVPAVAKEKEPDEVRHVFTSPATLDTNHGEAGPHGTEALVKPVFTQGQISIDRRVPWAITFAKPTDANVVPPPPIADVVTTRVVPEVTPQERRLFPAMPPSPAAAVVPMSAAPEAALQERRLFLATSPPPAAAVVPMSTAPEVALQERRLFLATSPAAVLTGSAAPEVVPQERRLLPAMPPPPAAAVVTASATPEVAPQEWRLFPAGQLEPSVREKLNMLAVEAHAAVNANAGNVGTSHKEPVDLSPVCISQPHASTPTKTAMTAYFPPETASSDISALHPERRPSWPFHLCARSTTPTGRPADGDPLCCATRELSLSQRVSPFHVEPLAVVVPLAGERSDTRPLLFHDASRTPLMWSGVEIGTPHVGHTTVAHGSVNQPLGAENTMANDEMPPPGGPASTDSSTTVHCVLTPPRLMRPSASLPSATSQQRPMPDTLRAQYYAFTSAPSVQPATRGTYLMAPTITPVTPMWAAPPGSLSSESPKISVHPTAHFAENNNGTADYAVPPHHVANPDYPPSAAPHVKSASPRRTTSTLLPPHQSEVHSESSPEPAWHTIRPHPAPVSPWKKVHLKPVIPLVWPTVQSETAPVSAGRMVPSETSPVSAGQSTPYSMPVQSRGTPKTTDSTLAERVY